MREWLAETENLWTTDGNYKRAFELEEIPIRDDYVYCHLTPMNALSGEGDPIVFHPSAGRVTVSCDLAFMMGKTGKGIPEEEALDYVGAYHIMAAFKDWYWLDNTPPPVHNPEQMQRNHWHWLAKFSRWTDGFNCLSQTRATPAELPNPYSSRMRIAIDGVGEVITTSADYVHHVPSILAHMSRTITFLRGTVFSLGQAGEVLTIPADRRLPEGTMVHAEIEGIGGMSTPIIDQRQIS
jgi:2-keto-4-pentenoate hydratase/2-oxohepta-3-ene-1,7-dioic acid hydratase in catechol pathway